MRIQEFGTDPKRPAREGSRPERGHTTEPRYKSAPVVPGGDNPDAIHPEVQRGDQVLVQDPDNIASVHSGIVKRIGRQFVYVTLKNGETVAAAYDEVSKDYDTLSKRAHKILNKKGPSKSRYKVDESLLEPSKRRQLIHFLAKKMDWEVNYLELATDHELIKWYKAVRAGQKPMESSDLQFDQTKRYAQQHYQNLDPDEAFQKFVQRSLAHSKEEDAAQDERLDRVEKQLANLQSNKTMEEIGDWLAEHGKAPRSLCTSSTPDEDLGASQLASCKSQGLRARDGEKSHLIGHRGSKVRIKVGGKKIKGKKYGGPLPDYGTRKGQK